MEPTTEEEVFPSAILGYRYWQILSGWEYLEINSEHQPLTSLTIAGGNWSPGINEAVCNKYAQMNLVERDFYSDGFHAFEPRMHSSPGVDCHCGFNAFHSFEKLDESDYRNISEVIGTVAGAGRVQLHRDGWRSEYAQIIALYDPKTYEHHSEELEKLSHYYGVPVFDNVSDLNEYSKKYAKPIASDQLRGLIR